MPATKETQSWDAVVARKLWNTFTFTAVLMTEGRYYPIFFPDFCLFLGTKNRKKKKTEIFPKPAKSTEGKHQERVTF